MRGPRTPRQVCLAACLGVVLVAVSLRPVHGQESSRTTLSDVVTDASGAVVPEVKVTVSRQGTSGESSSTTTTAAGLYELGNLPPGEYVLTAERTGFALHVQPGVRLSAPGARQDITLEIQGITETVTARSEPGNFTVGAPEIAFIQAADKAGLLSNESMVAVGGGSPVAQKIYVRDFEDTLLNVSVDGAPQAGELYHHQGRVQVEPEILKAIELEAGAGPATSGAGALTGALKLTTKDAEDLLAPDAGSACS